MVTQSEANRARVSLILQIHEDMDERAEKRSSTAYQKQPKLKAPKKIARKRRRGRGGISKKDYGKIINTLKTEAVCADCKKDWPPVALGFDHLPERGPKLFSISMGVGEKQEVLLEEIAKCEIVCHSCHAVRTNDRVKAKAAQKNLG